MWNWMRIIQFGCVDLQMKLQRRALGASLRDAALPSEAMGRKNKARWPPVQAGWDWGVGGARGS